MLTSKGLDGRRETWTIAASSPVFSRRCAPLGMTQCLTSDAPPCLSFLLTGCKFSATQRLRSSAQREGDGIR
jgi:hypothetical protein